jgi:hypothetical protein
MRAGDGDPNGPSDFQVHALGSFGVAELISSWLSFSALLLVCGCPGVVGSREIPYLFSNARNLCAENSAPLSVVTCSGGP